MENGNKPLTADEIKKYIKETFEEWAYGTNSDKNVCLNLILESITEFANQPKPVVSDVDLDKVVIVLKNDKGKTIEIHTNLKEVLEKDLEYFYDKLENQFHHNCTNESVNHCECTPQFEDYKFHEIKSLSLTSDGKESDAVEWISVKDRLPQQNKFVLVLYSETCMIVSKINSCEKEEVIVKKENMMDIELLEKRTTIRVYWEDIGYNKWVNGIIDFEWSNKHGIVTHWMPLPEPPKE